MRQHYLIILATALALSGCGFMNGKITETVHHDDNRVETTTQSGMSGGTHKTVSKHALAKNLCGLQSKLHNEQRIVVEQAPIIVVDGKAIEISDKQMTRFYNPSVAPFDMSGCVAEALRWKYERLASEFLSAVRDVATLGIKVGVPAYAAYKVLKDRGTEVNNPQPGSNVIITEDQGQGNIDQSARGTCPGTVDPDTGICVTPVEEPETEAEGGEGDGGDE